MTFDNVCLGGICKGRSSLFRVLEWITQGMEELHYVQFKFMIIQSMLIIKIMCIGIPLKVLCNKLFLVKGSTLFLL